MVLLEWKCIYLQNCLEWKWQGGFQTKNAHIYGAGTFLSWKWQGGSQSRNAHVYGAGAFQSENAYICGAFRVEMNLFIVFFQSGNGRVVFRLEMLIFMVLF